MKALFVLSIVAPVSILASLRLTGILQEPIAISETITLEAIKWEFERPEDYMHIDHILESKYVDDGLSVAFRLIVGIYEENSTVRYGADYIALGVSINSTATKPNANIKNIYVVFHTVFQPSLVDWVHTYFNYQNLSLLGISSGRTSEEDYQDAYVRLANLNNTERIRFWATAEWSLLTPNTQTHQMGVTYELIYYNGTSYKKIIQPFQLNILGVGGK